MSSYYDPSNLSRIPDLIKLAPKAAPAYLTFEHEAYHAENAIPLRTKELIAVAVAHVTGCPYCIDTHVRKFKELGGTMEEIMEAALVAASARAGAVLAHATNALLAFEGSPGPNPSAQQKDRTTSSGPECFC